MFDLGDTLFKPLPGSIVQSNLSAVADSAGLQVSIDELASRFRETRAELELELASAPFYLHHDFIGQVIRHTFSSFSSPLNEEQIQRFCASQREAVVDHLQPREDAFETLSDLRNDGFALAIVSNIDNDWIEPLRKRWDLDQYVELCLSSEEARSCKPDAEIFLQACKELDVDCQEVAFVGDSLVNDCEGSAAVGMHPIWFDKNRIGSVKNNTTPSVTQLRQVKSLVSLGK